MDQQKIGRAPDYTNACIVMFGVNLSWMLLFVLAVWGLAVAVLLCLALNHWIAWLETRRRAGKAARAPLGSSSR